jgi:hypothetical protein
MYSEQSLFRLVIIEWLGSGLLTADQDDHNIRLTGGGGVSIRIIGGGGFELTAFGLTRVWINSIRINEGLD